MCKADTKKTKKKRFKADWDAVQARKNRAIFHSIHLRKDEARELEEGMDEYMEDKGDI